MLIYFSVDDFSDSSSPPVTRQLWSARHVNVHWVCTDLTRADDRPLVARIRPEADEAPLVGFGPRGITIQLVLCVQSKRLCIRHVMIHSNLLLWNVMMAQFNPSPTHHPRPPN